MQFFKSVAVAVSALSAFAAAQSTSVAIHNMPDTVQVGKVTTLQTQSGNGPFTLTLRRGNPNDLQNVSTITTTGTGSSFNWTPASDLESGSDYAIMISQGDQSNYTPEFTITGGKAAGSSKPSPSAAAPAGYGASSAASTLSTAAKSSSANGCAVTQIGDGQPQAPASCSSSASAPAATSAAASPVAPKVTPVPGYNSAAVPAPYVPMPGATGSPAASNSTMPTYSVPSTPTGSSGSGSGSSSSQAPKGSSAPTSGAAHLGSSFALIAGAVAAFAFLN